LNINGGTGGFGSDDEDATRNLALPRGWEEKVEKELHHFRYEVTTCAIKIQGVSFIVFF
jgi:hypothetical protein